MGVLEVDLHVEEVTAAEKSLDVVVDIFSRVDSGGTKVSKGRLAIPKICAQWTEARNSVKSRLGDWAGAGIRFSIDWLLRSVNTNLTVEAKSSDLDRKGTPDIQDGLGRASRQIDDCLGLIAGRLGPDHDRELFGRIGITVMVRNLDRRTVPLRTGERD